MPLPVITDTMRCSIEGTLPNGHQWAQVWHHRKSGAITFTAAIAILDPLLFAFWNANLGAGFSMKSLQTTQMSMSQIRYTPLDGTSATSVITHALAGTHASDPLPMQVALVATFRTAVRGRSHRGRTYFPGWCEDEQTSGQGPTAANVTSVKDQFAGYLTSLVGSGVSLVVASYKLGTATDVANVTVDGRWDTQRRRLRP